MEYCKAQLGLPYWWGTFGQVADESLFKQKKRQYPNYYTASDFKSQYGKRVHDCVGLIKGYLWSDTTTSAPKYNSSQDKNVRGMFQNCSETGYVNTLPEIKGLILFNTNFTHVGVYIGDGQVIEAKGHTYGVVQTNVRDKKWYKWGKLNWITYIKGEKKEEEEEEEMRFNKIEEIPEYAKPIIQKLVNKNIINGNGDGLNLSEDMVRMFVFNDRAKLYENL